MLSQIEVNILRMLALGFGAEEIAKTTGLSFNEFISSYTNLLSKTKCWDDLSLGSWWAKNQHEYLDVLPDNVICFDFTKT